MENWLYLLIKIKIMYSLDCSYYDKEFPTLNELLDDIISSGMDPNYNITFNGEVTGDIAWDLIEPTI